MLLERYCERERRVEDIEKRGGTFIQRGTLEKNIVGDIVEGTLVFNDGDCADVLVKTYTFGGKRVLGPAKRTVDGIKNYNKLLDVFNALEEDKEYASHATRRQWIAGFFNIILYAMVGVMVVDIFRMDFNNLVPELVRLGAMIGVWFVAYYAAIAARRI